MDKTDTHNIGIVDIYGHIPDKAEVILGVGNYNNVHGLLTYFPAEDTLQMRSLPEVITPSVIELVLAYEKPSSVHTTNRIYFSLSVKGTHHYMNVRVELDGDKKVACACISPEKAFFWIDYSSIDKTPRSQLMAGGLYSLQTAFGEQDYVVSWKIQGFSNGDLVIFLPTTWYESSNKMCEAREGVMNLVERLNQIGFKGYTTQQWCEEVPSITHCGDKRSCGDCLGPCSDINHICYLNPDPAANARFICGDPSHEPKLNETSLVSFANTTPTTSGTTAAWIAIIAIIIIVALVTWGLSRQARIA